ncbi:MAG: class I SAM-dependent methyltransferase [Pseudomonadota bacterium]
MLQQLTRYLEPLAHRGPVTVAPYECPTEYQLELSPDVVVSKWLGAQDFPVAPCAIGEAWQGQYGVALQAGEYILTPQLKVSSETVLALLVVGTPAGHAQVNVDWALACGDQWHTLTTVGLSAPLLHQRLDISLAALAGHEVRFRVVRGDGTGDMLNVLMLRISPSHRMGRMNALASYDFRLKTEVGIFSGSSYSHQIYATGNTAVTGSGKVELSRFMPVARENRWVDDLRGRVDRRLKTLKPTPSEAAFSYSMRALGALLPMEPPDFFGRAREKTKSRNRLRPLRILSILAGAARVEEQLLSHCNGAVELTLLDASPELIQRAADRLASAKRDVKVKCLVGDINMGLPGKGEFDIIMCVSALHHVANLERVFSQVNERLADDGEFWSIGEQIGRNGNRLWPETYKVASDLFAAMPERFRRNGHSGSIDTVLSDRDFSIGCFEGIRSEELEPLLEAHFIPQMVYKRNAFLWRLVELTYGDNFDLSKPEDLQWVRRLIAAEITHWATGGRSTELHGVYRKKTVGNFWRR